MSDEQDPSRPDEGQGQPAGAGPAGTGSGSAGAGSGGADEPADDAAAAGTSDLQADLAGAAVDMAATLAAVEVEVDLSMAAVARERDEYLDALRRVQADFENYKKRMAKQQAEHVERAAGSLVIKLLPVCDTADLAIAHGGGEEVKQVWTALFDALEHEGLERIDPVGVPFDPTVHEAVAHEPGDGKGGPEVVEVMRAGYLWKGRVLRPAMVKVRG